MSDIDKLLIRLEKYIEATETARGTATELAKYAPLELNLYSLATRHLHELTAFRALLKDAQGTYLNV